MRLFEQIWHIYIKKWQNEQIILFIKFLFGANVTICTNSACQSSYGNELKFCPKCGTAAPAGASQAPAAGPRTPPPPPPMAARTPPPPPGIKPTVGKPVEPAKKSGSGAMIGGVVVVVILAVGGYFFMSSSKVSATSVTVSATENSVQVKTLLNNLLEFSSNNDWQKIEALTKELKAQSPFKKGDVSAAKSSVTEGEQALAAGNIQGAVDAFSKAVTADESNIDARVSWGYALYRIGNHSQATTVLGQALVAEPDKARAWLYVAEVFAETGKDDPSLSATKLAIYFSKNRSAALNAIKTDTETIKSRKFGNLINKNMDGLTALPAR